MWPFSFVAVIGTRLYAVVRPDGKSPQYSSSFAHWVWRFNEAGSPGRGGVYGRGV